MHVLTMLNQKGGVGKTSTTAHLSGTLGVMGRRVLLIDADPQGSLTQGFYGPLAFRELDPAETIAAMFAGHRPFASQIVRPTGVAGVDLVPGSKAATLYNVPCPELSDPDQQRCIRDFLDQARDDYDLVLIDVPPNLHLCSWAALVASDSIVVPLQPEDYGAQGIDPVLESVAEVQAGPNPTLGLLGFLVTMFDKRLGIHATYDAHLREMYGTEVFAAQFPMAKDFKEAIAARLPIALYKPKSAAAKAVRAIADELLARVDSRRIAAMMKEAG